MGDAPHSDPARLVDRAGRGRTPSLWAAPGAEAAWEVWLSDYMRLERPGSAACWRRVERIARARGWHIPKEIEFRRRLKREVSPAQQIRAREGRVAAMETYPHQTRTVAGMAPMDVVNGDGDRHAVFVRLPSGGIGRPLVWYWQDVRTRRIVGWRAGEVESADLVRLAFCDMVDAIGAPRAAVADNTHAASAKWLTAHRRRGKRWTSDEEDVPGIFDLLGIPFTRTSIVRTATGKGRGRGQSKPVERAILDLISEIDTDPRLAGAWTGPGPEQKPENYGSRAVEWGLFLQVVAEGVAAYNARPGRRMEAAAGRSIDEVWAEELATTPIRRLSPGQRAMLLLAVESSRIHRDGSFTLAAGRGAGLPPNRYYHEDLVARAGEKLVVRFDPTNLHGEVHVCARGGALLCTAECLVPAGFMDAAAGKEHARRRTAWMRHLDRAERERARFEELLERHGVVPAPAALPPDPKIVRIVPSGAGREPARDGVRDRLMRGMRRRADAAS